MLAHDHLSLPWLKRSSFATCDQQSLLQILAGRECRAVSAEAGDLRSSLLPGPIGHLSALWSTVSTSTLVGKFLNLRDCSWWDWCLWWPFASWTPWSSFATCHHLWSPFANLTQRSSFATFDPPSLLQTLAGRECRAVSAETGDLRSSLLLGPIGHLSSLWSTVSTSTLAGKFLSLRGCCWWDWCSWWPFASWTPWSTFATCHHMWSSCDQLSST